MGIVPKNGIRGLVTMRKLVKGNTTRPYELYYKDSIITIFIARADEIRKLECQWNMYAGRTWIDGQLQTIIDFIEQD